MSIKFVVLILALVLVGKTQRALAANELGVSDSDMCAAGNALLQDFQNPWEQSAVPQNVENEIDNWIKLIDQASMRNKPYVTLPISGSLRKDFADDDNDKGYYRYILNQVSDLGAKETFLGKRSYNILGLRPWFEVTQKDYSKIRTDLVNLKSGKILNWEMPYSDPMKAVMDKLQDENLIYWYGGEAGIGLHVGEREWPSVYFAVSDRGISSTKDFIQNNYCAKSMATHP